MNFRAKRFLKRDLNPKDTFKWGLLHFTLKVFYAFYLNLALMKALSFVKIHATQLPYKPVYKANKEISGSTNKHVSR